MLVTLENCIIYNVHFDENTDTKQLTFLAIRENNQPIIACKNFRVDVLGCFQTL